MLRNAAFRADVPRPRRRERPWRQPGYIKRLHDLRCVLTMSDSRYVEVHHLIQHKRKDRKRRDDRLALPLVFYKHAYLHDRDGDELRVFQEGGIPNPYALGEELWRIYEKGWDRDEAIRAIVEARE